MDRNENGTIKKGEVLNPKGRPKGSLNNTTKEIREFLGLIIDENKTQLQTDLKSLEPKDRIKVILEMMRFVLPTLKSIENQNDKVNPNTEIIVKIINPIEED